MRVIKNANSHLLIATLLASMVVGPAFAQVGPQSQLLVPQDGGQQANTQPQLNDPGQLQSTSVQNNGIGVDYLLPGSDQRLVSELEVYEVAAGQGALGEIAQVLRLIREEIRARKGQRFDNTQTQGYFSSRSWYEPSSRAVALSPIELQNIATIQRVEEKVAQGGALELADSSTVLLSRVTQEQQAGLSDAEIVDIRDQAATAEQLAAVPAQVGNNQALQQANAALQQQISQSQQVAEVPRFPLPDLRGEVQPGESNLPGIPAQLSSIPIVPTQAQLTNQQSDAFLAQRVPPLPEIISGASTGAPNLAPTQTEPLSAQNTPILLAALSQNPTFQGLNPGEVVALVRLPMPPALPQRSLLSQYDPARVQAQYPRMAIRPNAPFPVVQDHSSFVAPYRMPPRRLLQTLQAFPAPFSLPVPQYKRAIDTQESHAYILPFSNKRRLSEKEIMARATALSSLGNTPAVLRLARNEIFARKGHTFRSPVLQLHFKNQSWYKPGKKQSLNAIEKANVATILKLEQAYPGRRIYRHQSQNRASLATLRPAPVPVAKPAPLAKLAPGAVALEEPQSFEGTFLMPQSAHRPVTAGEVYEVARKNAEFGEMKQVIRLIRAEIYARYGYIFRQPGLVAYFSGQAWYRPLNANFSLHPVEQNNFNLLTRMERDINV